MPDPRPGRRERATRERRERILAASRELFDERGYDATTTAEIAERADIAHATLFRYAPTKSALLLMVGNDWFRAALDEGTRRAAVAGPAATRIRALVSPLMQAEGRLTEIARYQRYAVATEADDPHAARARDLVEELIADVGGILRDSRRDAPPDHADAAARATYAVLHLAILETEHDPDALEARLAPQLDLIVRGYLAAVPEEGRDT